VRIVVDDVEVPQWIYDKEEDLDPSLDQDQDLLDDDGNTEEERAGAALANLEQVLKTPAHDGPSEGDAKEEQKDNDGDSDACYVCGVGDDGDILLLCDSCDNACHLGCCKPARKTVPKGDWFCAQCKAKSKKRKATERPATASKENASTKKAATKNPKTAAGKAAPRAAPTRASRRAKI
jgi:hypothetical protein